jgi:hypothetical protein
MNQYFELVEIKSEDDLPKEEGRYWVEVKGEMNLEHWQYFPMYEDMRKAWMDKVHSYFCPVQVSKEVVYVPTQPQNWSDNNVTCTTDGIWLRKTQSIIVKQ